MNTYLFFSVAAALVVPVFVVLVNLYFKKSIMGTILSYFIAYTLLIILLGIIVGDKGPLMFLWTAPTCLVLALGFVLVITRKISAPIRNTSKISFDLAQGAGDLTMRLEAKSRDEIGELGANFNVFLDKLTGIIHGIRAAVRDTDAGGRELSDAMRSAAAAADAIDEIAARVRQVIEDQVGAVSAISSAVEEMARTMKSQDGKIISQASNVAESSSAIEQMMANIRSIAANLQNSTQEFETLRTAMAQGKIAVSGLKETVVELQAQSDSVYQANNIIKTIAGSTNLLAMNAAIEAAHAGEAGKGFAVVADEIRGLAEMSNKQSKVITDNLKTLRKTIEAAVGSVESTEVSFETVYKSVDTVSRVEEEIQHAIDEQSSGSTQILEAIVDIRRITEEVHAGSAEMIVGSEAVNEGMAQLRGVTEEVRNAAEEVAEKAKDVGKVVSRSSELLNRNVDNLRDVERRVSIFKLE